MLVFSRKKNEKTVCTCKCGCRLEVSVADIRGDKARLGFEAPVEDFTVHRKEIQEEIDSGIGPHRTPERPL